jgi:hypothetical protein
VLLVIVLERLDLRLERVCLPGREDGASSGHTASTRTQYTSSTVSVVVLLPLVASDSIVSLGRPLDGVHSSDGRIFFDGRMDRTCQTV